MAHGRQGFSQKAMCRPGVASICQHGINQAALLVDSLKQVFPPATHLPIGFVHAPGGRAGALVPAHPLLQLRRITMHPAHDRRTGLLPRRVPASSPPDPGSLCRICSTSGHRAGGSRREKRRRLEMTHPILTDRYQLWLGLFMQHSRTDCGAGLRRWPQAHAICAGIRVCDTGSSRTYVVAPRFALSISIDFRCLFHTRSPSDRSVCWNFASSSVCRLRSACSKEMNDVAMRTSTERTFSAKLR